MNGYVWVSARRPGAAAAADSAMTPTSGSGVGHTAAATQGVDDAPISLAERERVCRVRNALVALDRLCIAVSPASVAEVYRASLAADIPPKQMLLPRVLLAICRAVLGGELTSMEQLHPEEHPEKLDE